VLVAMLFFLYIIGYLSYTAQFVTNIDYSPTSTPTPFGEATQLLNIGSDFHIQMNEDWKMDLFQVMWMFLFILYANLLATTGLSALED
jgi:hypothetical protein